MQGTHRLDGHCSIRGATSLIGKVISSLLRLPEATAGAELKFEMKADEHEEIWTRHFPERIIQSRLLRAANGLISERMGPVRLVLSLNPSDGQLSMQLEAIRIFGLPWPKLCFPEIWAVERGDEDRFHFDIGAQFRHFGLLVAYSGYLNLPKAVSIP